MRPTAMRSLRARGMHMFHSGLGAMSAQLPLQDAENMQGLPITCGTSTVRASTWPR